MHLAALAVSSCPESTSTITRGCGDPRGEEMGKNRQEYINTIIKAAVDDHDIERNNQENAV